MPRDDESGRVGGHRPAEPFDQPDSGVKLVDLIDVGRFGVGRRRISARKPRLTPDLVDWILECRDDPISVDSEACSDRVGETLRILDGRCALLRGVCKQVASRPQGFVVVSPHDAHLPPRKWFPGVPLALAMLDQPAGGGFVVHLLSQFIRQHPLVVAVGCGVPLRALHVVDEDKGGLTAHRQPDVARFESFVDFLAELVDARPLFRRVRQGDARVLANAADNVREVELHLGEVGPARNRRRRRLVWGARGWDVTLTCKKTGRWVEANPACVAARPDAAREGVLGCLHAWFHSDRIGDVVVEAPVQFDEEAGNRDAAVG